MFGNGPDRSYDAWIINQLDWDSGKTGRDAELAVFITIATFRKPLSFAIIGMGKKLNNFEFIEDTIDN